MTNALNIDYWDLVTRSLRIAWKYKFLWFFGFFAASGGGGNSTGWREESAPWLRDFFTTHPYAFVMLIMAIVILALVFIVMSVICTGGLIRSSSMANRGEPISFSQTWRAGLSTFWRLLGLSVLAVVALFAVSIACAVPIVLSVMGGAPGIAIALVIGAILFLPYVAFLFILTFTVTYAEREIVLGGADIFSAIRAGWELARAWIGKSLMVWLVMLLSGLAYTMGLVLVLLVIAIPFVLIGIGNLFLALVLGIPIGIVIIVVASGWYGTYSYSVWTLAYEQLKGASAPDAGTPPQLEGAAGAE
jgi:hypothetical protein